MVEYTCEHCNKKFDHKGNYNKHIETHIKKAILENLTANTSDIKLYCKYCNEKFMSKKGRDIHINKYCKKSPNAIKDEQNIMLQNRLARIESKIDELATNQSKHIQTNIYVNGSLHVNGDVNVNGDVMIAFINDFKNSKSIFDSLSNKQLESIASIGGNAITKLVQWKHYNPNIPENHNILLNKKKGEHAQIFNGVGYDEILIDDIINFLITSSHQDICRMLTNENIKLDSTQKRNINLLIKKVNEQNPATYDMLREDLIQLMYDNREMVIETFKNLMQKFKSFRKIQQIE
jgi:hypothetical protein